MDLRLAVPAAACWVAATFFLPSPGALLAVALVAWTVGGAAVAISVALRHRAVARIFAAVAVCAATIALVASSAAAHADARRPGWLAAAAASGRVLSATLVATQVTGGKHFAATLVAGESGGTTRTASVPVIVFVDSPAARVGIGTTVSVRGTVAATAPEDDVSFLLFASDGAIVRRAPPGWLGWSNGLRDGFAREAAGLAGDGGRLLPGLAIGDTAAVDETLNTAMKASSLSHLTAVSGANCAIVIGLILLAGGAVGLRRTWRVVLSIVVLAGFVVLVTPEPSVLRAAVMATIALAAFAAGRPMQGIPVLAASVIVLLALDPWLARNYGFALSVLATGGLLTLAGPLARRMARWMPRWLAVVIAVPVAAQLSCQPVLILLNPTLPVFGVIANLLAEPAAPLATVAGLSACIVLPFAPQIGHLLAVVAWVPAAWIAAVARYFSGIPLGHVDWPGGAFGAVALAVITATVLLAVLGPLSARARRLSLFAAAGVLVTVLAFIGGTAMGATFGRPSNWQLADCDIGQGDAMVVRSEGRIALMDTGPDPALLTACLTTLGIGRINLLVLSHFDLDHVGGTDAVVGRVDRVLFGPIAQPTDGEIINRLTAGGARAERVSQGSTGILGDLRWSVLWPPDPLGDVEPGNPASVTVRFDPAGDCPQRCLSSLFLGDLGEVAQNRMLDANPQLAPVDVVEVSHHGSSDQSARLYGAVEARVGLIGVGIDNGYGHPTKRLLDILRTTGTEAERTDTDGLVLVAPGQRPGTMAVWKEHSHVGTGD